MNRLNLRDSIAATIRLARSAAPAAALASGLLAPAAWSAPGDLDTTFGDVGRLGPILDLDGPAWSLEAVDSNGILLGGGDACEDLYYCFYYHNGFEATNFVRRLVDSGSTDLSFDAARLAQIRVFDIVQQTDGKVVAVGQRVSTDGRNSQLVVFRLNPAGSVDTEFGVSGIAELPTLTYGTNNSGTSVALDPDGRIVVAGWNRDKLIVVRLLASGVLDDSFGTSGAYQGTDSIVPIRINILRTAAGYRVATYGSTGCHVVALTATGVLDNAFGSAGTAPVDVIGPSVSCSSIVSQPDGRLLVAGSADGHGFATRLLASGQPDPSFSTSIDSDAMRDATALALAADGSVFVGGTGVNGASVMRLQASGELDTIFGNGGSTAIDLPSEFGTYPTINDMAVQNGKLVVAGGVSGNLSSQPYVVRLVTGSGLDGPGVLGVSPPFGVDVKEQDGEAVVTVRRTGGRAGQVSVHVQTQPATDVSAGQGATAGLDYTSTARTLTWDDGDVGNKQFVIPIMPDALGTVPERPEYFNVALSAVQGNAGLGTSNASVAIAADGAPAGQFSIDPSLTVRESDGGLTVAVSRNDYYEGAVSVTVDSIAGTATAGTDYIGVPVTLTWADGERGAKSVNFTIVRDQDQENAETFSVLLSAPTGGAVLGAQSTASVTILDSRPINHSSSGGGAVGLLSMLLLGVAGVLRRVSRWAAP